jgi:glyoxylase-like metal-dependent hydrolase (beta-lactamase superfamily II)
MSGPRSYLVASEGVAAVIDPRPDVDAYIDADRQKGLRIEHIIETHLHADFVSGHHELAERTGARIYLGAGSGAAFPHTAVKDGDSIQFGKCRFDFIETPGHTLESVRLAATDLAAPPAREQCLRATRSLLVTSAAPIFRAIARRRSLQQCSTRAYMRSS